MKLKIKLDQKAILDFLLHHVEKIGLALFAVVFLWIVYAATQGAKHFEKSPEQLQQAISTGKAEIEGTPDEVGLVVADYVSQAKRSRIHIQESPYSHLVLWDNPLFGPKNLRGEPPLFTVQQLRATPGIGAFRSTGAEGVVGKRWVVVTGLVSMEKQERAYLETFKQSILYEPQNDVPVYLGYWIERAEVSSAGDAANPNWEKAKTIISRVAIDDAMKEWGMSSSVASDVVDAGYVDQALTFPLGPLMNRNWDVTVAYEPEVPLRKMAETAKEPTGTPRQEKPAGKTREPDRENPFGDRRPAGEMDPAMMAMPMMPGMPDAMGVPGQEKSAAAYKLFRFFDFSVEPNKQYVYRVRLALKNPNRDMKPALLAKPALATATFLRTQWSDASTVASVPGDTRVLAGTVTPARPGGEPLCKILAVKWLETNGVEAFVDKSKIGRGQVADFPGEKFQPSAAQIRQPEMMMDPGMMMLTPDMMMPGMMPEPAARTGARGKTPRRDVAPPGATPSSMVVDFNTGVTVVDMRGGERLAGNRGMPLNAVGELLLLNPDGTLSMRNELDDEATYQRLVNPSDKASSPDIRAPGSTTAAPGTRPRSALDEATGERPPPKKKPPKPRP